MNKHLIILGIRGIPAAHGGFESFAERLAPWMIEQGWEVTVYCQGSQTGKRYEDSWQGCRLIHMPVGGDGPFATIKFDTKSALEAANNDAVLLTLGYNTAFLTIYTMIRGRHNIVNMDGIEWRREKYSLIQKAYLWINERIAAATGTALIADHPTIADHHAKHASRSKISTIPYGSDKISDAEEACLDCFNLRRSKFFTIIARPEPENSILEMVRAFSRRRRDFNLVVLGNYSVAHRYQQRVLNAASDEVIFPGAIYDRRTLDALRFFSRGYLHGHKVGGTNPSLVEALGASNPVIAHDNSFNRWVAGEAGCYFTDEDECELQINKLISDDRLVARKQEAAGRRWRENFTWDRVLKDYHHLLDRVRLQ
jgi:glycosyltransferase involved in cell wall biosynthesis